MQLTGVLRTNGNTLQQVTFKYEKQVIPNRRSIEVPGLFLILEGAGIVTGVNLTLQCLNQATENYFDM